MDLSKRPTQAKKVSSVLKAKLKKLGKNSTDEVKEGVDLVGLTKKLAKRQIQNQEEEESSSEDES